MVALLAAAALMIVACGAEWLHSRRCRRIAALAFGPSRRPALWARFAPLLRIAALGALGWASVTLLQLPPKVHQSGCADRSRERDTWC